MQTHRSQYFFLFLGFLIGLTLRLDFVRASFPANDGGLFFVMIRDLQANHFALPWFTSYNAAGIPFAYPPLGLYLAGILDAALPFTLLEIMAWLPLVLNMLVGLAVYSLAHKALTDNWTAVAATAAWYLVPDASGWLVMGGGLPRSLGLLWAVLAIQSAHRMYSSGSVESALATAVLSALALVSHLEMAWFAAWAIALMAAFKARSLRLVLLSILVVIAALSLSAPWWGTVVARHGTPVFLGTLSGSNTEWPLTHSLVMLMRGGMHSELVPVLCIVGIAGFILCFHRRQYWLPAWLLLVFATAKRGPSTTATVPVALLAGYAFATWIAPELRRMRPPVRTTLLASALLLALIDNMLVNVPVLASLDTGEREVMGSLATVIGPSARVLVLPTDGWEADRSSEWFPALSGLVSVSTVQGSEWLPDGEFTKRIDAHDRLLHCVYTADLDCLESWISETESEIEYVYVPQHVAVEPHPYVDAGTPPCRGIEVAMRRDPKYTLLIDGSSVHLYAIGAAQRE